MQNVPIPSLPPPNGGAFFNNMVLKANAERDLAAVPEKFFISGDYIHVSRRTYLAFWLIGKRLPPVNVYGCMLTQLVMGRHFTTRRQVVKPSYAAQDFTVPMFCRIESALEEVYNIPPSFTRALFKSYDDARGGKRLAQDILAAIPVGADLTAIAAAYNASIEDTAKARRADVLMDCLRRHAPAQPVASSGLLCAA